MLAFVLRKLGCVELAGHLEKTLVSSHIVILTVWFFLAAALICTTGWLAYISGHPSRYDNVNQDWESCLFAPNAVVLPISQLLDTSPLAPLMDYFGVDIDNMQLSLGAFVYSLIYICVNTTALTFVGHLILAFSSLRRDWLFPSSMFALWCCSLSLSYYTTSPPLPLPTSTTSTLTLLLYWLDLSKFTNINDGNNVCSSAYYFVLFVALVNLAMVTSLVVVNVRTLSAAITHCIETNRFPKICTPAFAAFALCVVLAVSYTGQLVGRISTSITSLNCLNQYDTDLDDIAFDAEANERAVPLFYPEIFYPFQPGYINLTALCWAGVFVGISLSTFSVQKFGYAVAMFCAIVYTVAGTPSMFFVMSQYYEMGLQNDSICFEYFREPQMAPFYLYPSEHQAKMYCQGTRVATFSALAMYVGMVVMIGLSAHVYLSTYKLSDDDVSTAQAALVRGVTSTPLGGSYAFRWTSDNFSCAPSPSSAEFSTTDYQLYTEEQMEVGDTRVGKASVNADKRSNSCSSHQSPGLSTVALNSPADLVEACPQERRLRSGK